MMKILLVDVDSSIPNLALMKISSYYKSSGHSVDLLRVGFTYYPNCKKRIVDTIGYDRCFLSVIYPQNKDKIKITGPAKTSWGGSGYSIKKCLPPEVHCLEPDYSIYPDNDKSWGYITRGCIRNCDFCIVQEKEGNLYKENNIDDIVRHKKVEFLDNNILAYPGHKRILERLGDMKLRCRFMQGLDIRVVDEEDARLLARMNYMGDYIFAFDDINLKDIVEQKTIMLKRHLTRPWEIKYYIYCHPDQDITDDLLYRIEYCKRNKIKPYLMRDIKCWDSENRIFYNYLASWCNQPSMFKKMTFYQFMQKKTPTKWRVNLAIETYYKGRKMLMTKESTTSSF